MSGLAALLNSDVVQKYFPFRNATPRSSVSIQLLYDLGVIGSNAVAGVGDLTEIERKVANLEARDLEREAEVAKLREDVRAIDRGLVEVKLKCDSNTKAIDETILPKLEALQQELDTFTSGTNYKCDQLAIKTIEQQKEIDQNKTKLSEVETELVLHKNNGEHWTAQQIDERINAIVNP